MNPKMPTPAPRINPETRPYWEGTTQGKLLLPHCQLCKRVLWYPKTLCSACGHIGVDWVESRGTGSIYTYTIMRATRAAGPYSEAVPYVVAYVELDEGPRIMTNIVDCDMDKLEIGQRVKVVFHDTGEGAALPRFVPA
jgi:uncharacterized OB-fold protein